MATRRRAVSLTAIPSPPDRAAGLGPPPTPAPAAPPVPLPVVPEAGDAPAAEVISREEPKPQRKARDRTGPNAAGRNVGVRIPGSLFTKLNAARAATGETHEMWFTRQFAAVYNDLEAQYRLPDAPVPPVPVRTQRRRRLSGEVLAQYPLRLTAEEASALEKRLEELHAPSLSDLVTTIVRLGLQHEQSA